MTRQPHPTNHGAATLRRTNEKRGKLSLGLFPAPCTTWRPTCWAESGWGCGDQWAVGRGPMFWKEKCQISVMGVKMTWPWVKWRSGESWFNTLLWLIVCCCWLLLSDVNVMEDTIFKRQTEVEDKKLWLSGCDLNCVNENLSSQWSMMVIRNKNIALLWPLIIVQLITRTTN